MGRIQSYSTVIYQLSWINIKQSLTWWLLVVGSGRWWRARLFSDGRTQVFHQLLLLGSARETKVVHLRLELDEQHRQVVVKLRRKNTKTKNNEKVTILNFDSLKSGQISLTFVPSSRFPFSSMKLSYAAARLLSTSSRLAPLPPADFACTNSVLTRCKYTEKHATSRK